MIYEILGRKVLIAKIVEDKIIDNGVYGTRTIGIRIKTLGDVGYADIIGVENVRRYLEDNVVDNLDGYEYSERELYINDIAGCSEIDNKTGWTTKSIDIILVQKKLSSIRHYLVVNSKGDIAEYTDVEVNFSGVPLYYSINIKGCFGAKIYRDCAGDVNSILPNSSNSVMLTNKKVSIQEVMEEAKTWILYEEAKRLSKGIEKTLNIQEIKHDKCNKKLRDEEINIILRYSRQYDKFTDSQLHVHRAYRYITGSHLIKEEDREFIDKTQPNVVGALKKNINWKRKTGNIILQFQTGLLRLREICKERFKSTLNDLVKDHGDRYKGYVIKFGNTDALSMTINDYMDSQLNLGIDDESMKKTYRLSSDTRLFEVAIEGVTDEGKPLITFYLFNDILLDGSNSVGIIEYITDYRRHLMLYETDTEIRLSKAIFRKEVRFKKIEGVVDIVDIVAFGDGVTTLRCINNSIKNVNELLGKMVITQETYGFAFKKLKFGVRSSTAMPNIVNRPWGEILTSKPGITHLRYEQTESPNLIEETICRYKFYSENAGAFDGDAVYDWMKANGIVDELVRRTEAHNRYMKKKALLE